MPADLHTAIRDALHADDITAADLRYSELRQTRPRRAHQGFAIAGAVAAVAIVAVVLAFTGGRADHNGATGKGGPETGIVGYRWRLVRLNDSYGSLPVPASLHAQIAFAPNDYVLGNDTVNALQGRYRITASGYAVRNAGTTLVGVGDVPQQRKRTIAAVDAMFFPVESAPGNVEVAVSVHGSMLTLRRTGFTLTLRRAGVQPAVPAGRPTPSPAKTG